MQRQRVLHNKTKNLNIMKNITKFFAVAIIATLYFSACGSRDVFNVPYACYTIKGRVIDKETKEPIEEIMVVLGCLLPKPQGGMLKTSPPPRKEGWSDENGYFRAYEYIILDYMQERNDSVLVGFFNGRYNNAAFHKDTTIFVDFKDVPLLGPPDGNYKGSCFLYIGDIELERID